MPFAGAVSSFRGRREGRLGKAAPDGTGHRWEGREGALRSGEWPEVARPEEGVGETSLRARGGPG